MIARWWLTTTPAFTVRDLRNLALYERLVRPPAWSGVASIVVHILTEEELEPVAEEFEVHPLEVGGSILKPPRDSGRSPV